MTPVSISLASNSLISISILLLVAACDRNDESRLPGTLEWDRIALTAEAFEPIVRIAVSEGEGVVPGQVLVELDSKRIETRMARAAADIAQLQARLDEALRGARSETIDAARARVAQSRAVQNEAERAHTRTQDLARRGFISDARTDETLASQQRAQAETAAANAQLRELTRGTRSEQIAQAQAALEAAQAAAAELRLSRDRYTVRAPRGGRVDALPFKVGDQPPAGATVVSLLVGDAPYARVYVPAPQRASLQIGARFRVRIEGIDAPFNATLRRIASEPSFTPYFALTGDDASRLVYRAELVLEGDAAKRLAAGLTLTAEQLSDDSRQ